MLYYVMNMSYYLQHKKGKKEINRREKKLKSVDCFSKKSFQKSNINPLKRLLFSLQHDCLACPHVSTILVDSMICDTVDLSLSPPTRS